jgi:adhesin/invasin
MIHTFGRKRFDALDSAIASSLALLFLAACSGDSTSPTPTATSIVVASGAAQVATVAAALAAPVVVKVTDQSGNPMAGVTVSFAPSATAGSVSAAQVTTDATGSASVTWTLGTLAGADSVMVTAGTLASVAVVATATPDVPAAVTIVSGNNQSAPIDSALATTLAVKVADQYGNVIPNATVQWSDDAGGTLSATTSVTDANGIAQVQYTLGPTPGPEDVVATLMVGSVPMTASFVEIGN